MLKTIVENTLSNISDNKEPNPGDPNESEEQTPYIWNDLINSLNTTEQVYATIFYNKHPYSARVTKENSNISIDLFEVKDDIGVIRGNFKTAENGEFLMDNIKESLGNFNNIYKIKTLNKNSTSAIYRQLDEIYKRDIKDKSLDWAVLMKILEDHSKTYIEVKSIKQNGSIKKNTIYNASLELSDDLIRLNIYYKKEGFSDYSKFEKVFTNEGNMVENDKVQFDTLYKVMKIIEPTEDIIYAENIKSQLSPIENSLNNIITGQQNLDGNIGKGLMGAFTSVYQLYGVVAMGLIITIFVLTTIDMLKVLILETIQKIRITLSPNMFNKDTIDFSNLLYAKNNKDLEPYSIYLKQTIISNMFQLTTLFILTLLIQVGLYMILNTLNALKKITYNENLTPISADSRPLQVIGLMLVIAFILNSYYNSQFLKNVQPNIITSSDNIQRITDSIYNNITTNEEFLNSVLDENINESIKIINKQGTRYETIGSMIFTLSLYNYFKINVSTSNPIFKNIREIFTLKERRLRTIKPVNYMYYNQNIFIPNLHTIIEPHISADTNVLNTTDKRDTVRKNVASRIKNVNLALTGLFSLSSTKRHLRTYILAEWIIISVCMIGIYVIYRKEFNSVYVSTIAPLLKTINENTIEQVKKIIIKILKTILRVTTMGAIF